MRISVGEYYEEKKVITEVRQEKFIDISEDNNMLHTDDAYAVSKGFKGKVVHGMHLGSLLSGILGAKYPGDGTIYIEQNLKFVKPVYLGTAIIIRVEVADILNETKGIVKLLTKITDEDGALCVDGYAIVKVCL